VKPPSTQRPTGVNRTSRPAPHTPPEGSGTWPQPAPGHDGRTWTIATTKGHTATGHLPAWAQHDPSVTGVGAHRLDTALADITHQVDVGGLILPVSHAEDAPEDTGVLAITIDCKPYAEVEDSGPLVPTINVQIVDDYWIRDLDPARTVALGKRLRALGDLLVNTAAPQLAAARADWTHHTPWKRTKRTRPRTLHQEPSAVTWAREKAGLTKRALAQRVGISEQLASEIESGWRSATPTNLAKIARALNCPIVALERKRPRTTGRPPRQSAGPGTGHETRPD